jgi:ferredoxin-NADP reductase
MTSDRTILITGVTGNQGGAVARSTQPINGCRFRIRLVYSNRTVDESSTDEALETLQRDNPQFRILWTLTRPELGTWTGRTGRVAGNGSTTLLAEAAADRKQPVYYLCGAPGFIEACLKSLVESGTPEAAIKFEICRGHGAAA